MKSGNFKFKFYVMCFLIFPVFAITLYSCDEDIKKEIIFEAGVVDTIHFNYSNGGHITVPIKMDSVTYDFTFDTGAHTTHFDTEIPIERISNNTSSFFDYNGEKRATVKVWPEKIKIGNIAFLNFKDSKQNGLSIDGILGNNILRELCWAIDFRKSSIYVTEDISNLKIQLENGLPFKLIGNNVHVTAQIGNDTVPLLIDTGDPSAAIRINTSYLDEANMSNMIKWEYFRESVNIYNEAKPVVEDVSYETILPLRLGNRTYKDELVKFVDYREYAGVGLGFLSRFEQVIFDYPNRQLYFLGEGHKTVTFHIETNEALNGSGIWIGLQDSLVVVKGLSNQAKNEGLKLGDAVLGIDDDIFPKNIENDFFQKQKEMVEYINYKDGDSTIQSFEEIKNSKFMQLTKKFRNLDTVAVLKIKREDADINLVIKPKENFSDFPDTLQTYTPLNLDFVGLFYSKGYWHNQPHIYITKK
ncbi:retropepsin-like aspartic protease [Leeuwenhoekiella marinoflava]|uniref:retropepsin-like aspartic protease n=1 Tax=Leeuwenhoekiella marinoflava TaxID=988 RepID=UPI003003A24B